MQVPAVSWSLVQRSAREKVLEGAPLDRVLRIVTTVVVVCGLWLRARGYLYSTFSLWLDEAQWAIRLFESPLSEQLIRPIGFMAVTKWLSKLLGPSEAVLRFLPWAAGMVTTVLSPALARRLFQSAGSRLFFVAVLAFHPGAIDLSKEFKPYALSLGLHFALLLLVLRYTESGKVRDLVAALGVASVAVLFAQDVVFAYPGFFVVLGLAALSSRSFRHLAAIAGMAALTLGVVAALYVWMWSKMDPDKDSRAWGKKYDIFYVPSKAKVDHTDWTVGHYADLAAAPGTRRALWSSPLISKDRMAELRSVDAVCWILLHVAGLAFLVRARRYREGLLLVTPGVLMVGFNAFGFWPLGEFRASLFELVYMTAIAAISFDRAAKRVRAADFIPAGVLVFAPLFMFERTWNARKETYTMTAYFPQVMKELLRMQGSSYSGPREKIFADSYSCKPWRYYMVYHPTYSETFGKELWKRTRLVCSGTAPRAVVRDAQNELKTAPRAWIVASKGAIVNNLEKAWPDSLEKAQQAKIAHGQHLIIAVEPKKELPPPEPEAPPPDQPEPESE